MAMTIQRAESGGPEQRLAAYLDHLAGAAGHADRIGPLQDYTKGLLLPIERKSVEPMAARLAPGNVRQMHQSLHHVVAMAAWSDAAMLERVREQVLPAMCRTQAIAAWIVDDTGVPKKGKHSVGVARQYCGQLGKQDNCQVAVTVSIATAAASLPLAHRLYLPEAWAADAERRRKAGVPPEIGFETKPAIALAQLRDLAASGLPRAPVLADAGYGNYSAFRDGVEALGLSYAVGIQSATTVWPPGAVPPPRRAQGRPPARLRGAAPAQPLAARALALGLGAGALEQVSWREGTRGPLRSRFLRLRVRSAHRNSGEDLAHQEQWLLIEWPPGEAEPTKYWLSNLPASIGLKEMVAITKLRWRIERDYEELKQEIGLGHFEGRNWRGFHHHATLCIAAYGFLVAERCLFPPPRGAAPAKAPRAVRLPRLPAGFQPRGAPGPDRTP
jgi:SRSO17 transposase